jgi:hypothetical protein
MERRQQPRYPCHLRASLVVDGQMFEAMCTDIGQGGAYLATAVMAAPGTQLGIALASPHGTSMIAAKAEVLYTVRRSATRPTGVAVRWLEMNPALNRAIALIEDGPALAASEADTSPLPIRGAEGMAATAPYRAVPPGAADLPRTQPKLRKR